MATLSWSVTAAHKQHHEWHDGARSRERARNRKSMLHHEPCRCCRVTLARRCGDRHAQATAMCPAHAPTCHLYALANVQWTAALGTCTHACIYMYLSACTYMYYIHKKSVSPHDGSKNGLPSVFILSGYGVVCPMFLTSHLGDQIRSGAASPFTVPEIFKTVCKSCVSCCFGQKVFVIVS
jgi:hypothetical protein